MDFDVLIVILILALAFGFLYLFLDNENSKQIELVKNTQDYTIHEHCIRVHYGE